MEGIQGLGRALAALRTAKGMRQREVAEALGVRKSSVSRLETAGVNPRMATLARYLGAIGCSFDDLALALRTVNTGQANVEEVVAGSTQAPPSIERDVAWLLRRLTAMADELSGLREEFYRFRTDVSNKLVRAGAKRVTKGRSSGGDEKNGPNAVSD